MFCPGWPDTVRQINESGIRLLTPWLYASRRAARFQTFGAGSVWTLNQGDGTISRVDTKSRKVVATVEVGIPGTGGEIAFGLGHVWATVFQIPISEIDPETNKVTRQWFGPGGDSIRAGHGAIWLSDLRGHSLSRIDPAQLKV